MNNITVFVKKAEEFLVKVKRKNSDCTTFNQLRAWFYTHADRFSVEDLPATSSSIQLHILRAFYIVYTHTHCLDRDAFKLDPLLFGYEEQDDLLMPAKVKILLPPPEEFVPNCTCKKCKTKSCVCIAAQIPCCKFCGCDEKKTCHNEFSNSD